MPEDWSRRTAFRNALGAARADHQRRGVEPGDAPGVHVQGAQAAPSTRSRRGLPHPRRSVTCWRSRLHHAIQRRKIFHDERPALGLSRVHVESLEPPILMEPVGASQVNLGTREAGRIGVGLAWAQRASLRSAEHTESVGGCGDIQLLAYHRYPGGAHDAPRTSTHSHPLASTNSPSAVTSSTLSTSTAEQR